jgi:hypothetical protein
MTTAATVITRARRGLLAGIVEERNQLSGSLDTSATTVGLTYEARGLRAGVTIEIDSELMYVWTVAGSLATVQRGFDGTTATSHASGADIIVNPRFPRALLFDYVNHELADLSTPDNGLFQIKHVDLVYNGSDRAVDLTGVPAGDVIGIQHAAWRYTADSWPEVRRYRLIRNQDTTDFPSGYALTLDEDVRAGEMRVTYRAPFTLLTAETQDLYTTGGLPQTADDIVEIGVEMLALLAREAKRNFLESQGDTRRAQEVNSGAMNTAWRGLAARRQQRIQAEQARLARMYPTRVRK